MQRLVWRRCSAACLSPMSKPPPIVSARAVGSLDTQQSSLWPKGKVLDDPTAAPEQYHNGLTVSKTFALAINEARKLHSDAFRLLLHVSLLAPIYLFSEGREALGEQCIFKNGDLRRSSQRCELLR